MRERKMELLAPGGGVDEIKAAILAGADAVYCGLEKFSARDRAANVSENDIVSVVHMAHKHDCLVYVTVNIIVLETEYPTVVRILNKLANAFVDGVIVQDIGLMYLLHTHFPSLSIHASTQMTTHNEGQLQFLAKMGTVRANLCRELNIDEIAALTQKSHRLGMETEVFVHGANCISFSGQCYMSSATYGNSGNRGRCSQPCREEYIPTEKNWRYPLNLKDNTAYLNLPEIRNAGVTALKIEGRIKKSNYVYWVVRTFAEQLRRLRNGLPLANTVLELRRVYNRDFSNGFLTGEIHKNMFIDNPKDNAARYFLRQSGAVKYKEIKRVNQMFNSEKKTLIERVKKKISILNSGKIPLTILASGQENTPLCFTVSTPDTSFNVHSDAPLFHSAMPQADNSAPPQRGADGPAVASAAGHNQLNRKLFLHKLRAINLTAYRIDDFQMHGLAPGLCIPYEEIVRMKNKILYVLNGNRESVQPVQLPKAQPICRQRIAPQLSVLISDFEDLHLVDDTDATVYFELPDNLSPHRQRYVELFRNHPDVVPWFPPVTIGDDFTAAVALLTAGPKQVVANNMGVAHAAWTRGIPWTAGPYLNTANSFSLRCLSEMFNCTGAFISNELNLAQIESINPVENMALHFSIFHPVVLMTSRQCLFHQITGCTKTALDEDCLATCQKSAVIENTRNISFSVDKRQGNYHRIYFEKHYLNTRVAKDAPNVFSSFLVDLKDVATQTQTTLTKREMVRLFEMHIQGSSDATQTLRRKISPTTCEQYAVGI